MKRMTVSLLAAAIAAALLLPAWASIYGEAESRLHIVPLDGGLLSSDARDIGVFVLSADEALVEVLSPAAGRFGARTSIELGPTGAYNIYFVPSHLPGEFLTRSIEDGGVEVIHSNEERVIFRADSETAYNLYLMGYVVTRVRFIPLHKLAGRPDARAVHEVMLAERPLTTERLGFMKAMSESASADSLRDLIYWLGYDSEADEYRSRFAARYDLDEDVTPVLYEKLRGYIEPAGGQVHMDNFPLLRGSHYLGQASSATNVWGEMPGAKTSAYYVICGHFDATASHDDDFSTLWTEMPAPGADDNATGTAAVIECARLMAPMALDFGVRFALFSAEENNGAGNLQGSAAFVDSLTEADSIIAVINLDMIGYWEEYRKCEISYGWRSEWLSWELEAMAESLDLETEFESFQRAQIHSSDHASFWLMGIPALMLSERNEDYATVPIYPYYHSGSDTLGNLDMDQVRDNVALIVGYFSRFAEIPGDSLSDLEVSAESMEFDWDGRARSDPMVAGQDLKLTVRAINTGGSFDGSRDYEFKVWRSEIESGELVYDDTVELNVVSGGTTVAVAEWKTPENVYGDIVYSVSLLPVDEGVESDISNNQAMATLAIAPQEAVLQNFHVYPNPTGSPADARMAGDILTKRTDFLASYVARVYDPTGLRLLKGEGLIDTEEIDIPLSDLTGDASTLSPGLYICVIELNVRDQDENITAVVKFGVVSGQ